MPPRLCVCGWRADNSVDDSRVLSEIASKSAGAASEGISTTQVLDKIVERTLDCHLADRQESFDRKTDLIHCVGLIY